MHLVHEIKVGVRKADVRGEKIRWRILFERYFEHLEAKDEVGPVKRIGPSQNILSPEKVNRTF